jgi:hypothetical protein
MQGIDSDMGSPVDLAKSYMQSLPPWQSPFLGSQKFNTSSSKYSSSLSKVIQVLCSVTDLNFAVHTCIRPNFLW